jgi:hypothetical protein
MSFAPEENRPATIHETRVPIILLFDPARQTMAQSKIWIYPIFYSFDILARSTCIAEASTTGIAEASKSLFIFGLVFECTSTSRGTGATTTGDVMHVISRSLITKRIATKQNEGD